MYSSAQHQDDESTNPLMGSRGMLQRKSTNEELEARRVRLSSESGARFDFTPAPREGLTSAQAADLLKKYGRNELEDKKIPKVNFPILTNFKQ
jgi:hypothetical protein